MAIFSVRTYCGEHCEVQCGGNERKHGRSDCQFHRAHFLGKKAIQSFHNLDDNLGGIPVNYAGEPSGGSGIQPLDHQRV